MPKPANTVYILRCADGTLYTGSTIDLDNRMKKHNGIIKGGAKYTRARRPVELVYKEGGMSLAQARAREAEIKRMNREDKLELIKNSPQDA